MQFSILKTTEEVENHIQTVVLNADRNKKALGFLPPAAYQAQAEKGRLWVLVDENKKYIGHLMFGGTRQDLKITQIFITPKSRDHQLATSVIDALKVYAKENQYQYIQARVAADLKANEFWEKNEFVILNQVKGGESTKRVINIRAWFAPNSGLFLTSGANNKIIASHRGLLRRQSYVLDANVVIDLARHREGYEDIERLVQLSMRHEIRLRRTPELRVELNRGKLRRASDLAIRFAELITPLAIMSNSDIDEHLFKLMPVVFPHRLRLSELTINERSDLIHLAYCIRYEQDAFITRDGPILNQSNKVASEYGLEVLTPYDIIPPENVFSNAAYMSKSNDEMELTWYAANMAKEEIFEYFTEPLQKRISAINPDWLTSQDPNKSLLCASYGGKPFAYAYVGWDSSNMAWEVVLSSVESQPATQILLDSIMASIYERCGHGQCFGVSLSLSPDSIDVYDQAVRNGFVSFKRTSNHQSPLRLIRIVFKGTIDKDEWSKLKSLMRRFACWDLTSRIPDYLEFVNTGSRISSSDGETATHAYIKLANFEDLVAPGIILSKKRPAFIIPIRPEYADHLFPELDKSAQIVPRLPAGMHTERVYFSRYMAHSPIETGGVAVFYVSGNKGYGGTAVTVARVTSVSDMTEREAGKSYFSRGVMNLEDNDNLIRVITFSNIIQMITPVQYSWMKSENIIGGANLVTAQKITTEQLRRILIRGELRSS